MLNFRNTNILFAFLLLVLAAIQFHYGFDLSWIIALILVYTLFLFYGSFNVRSNFFIKTYYGGNTSNKQIAITFDDGPARFTPHILDVLKEHEVPATFFALVNRLLITKSYCNAFTTKVTWLATTVTTMAFGLICCLILIWKLSCIKHMPWCIS